MYQWGNYQNNLNVWKLIKNKDGEQELNNKSIKLYEIITIHSGLCKTFPSIEHILVKSASSKCKK